MIPHHHDDVEFDLPDKDDPSARNDLEYVAEYDDRPTRKQLSYLRTLAERTGQTFAYPRTIEQAAREIRRLKAVRPSARVERAIDVARSPTLSPKAPERRERRPRTRRDRLRIDRHLALKKRHTMATPTIPAARIRQVGDRVELGRYRTADGTERGIFGQRINGVVRLVDRPLSGAGRSYLIERELEQDGHAALKALVIDYLLCRCRHRRY